MQLDGTVSLVTGGAGGLGRQIALTLAKAGSKVAILDIQQTGGEAVEKELQGISDGKFFNCDMTKVANINQAVQEVKQHFGKIDILVNCAGLVNRAPIEEVTEAQWDLVTNVNLKAAFFTSQAVVKVMKENNGGKIVNMSSIRAHASDDHHTIYDVTKAGIEAITRSFAMAYAKDNINVNAVAPGWVLTGMAAENLTRKEFLDDVKRKVPAGRLLEPREVAETVLFLASNASTGVNGHSILIDGGSLAVW